MALQNIGGKGAAAAAVLGLGALLVGCSREGALSGAPLTANAAGAPLTVACEPHQRAIVRQTTVNGAVQPQVQCETVAEAGTIGTTGYAAAAPVAYQTGFQPASYVRREPLENTRMVRTAYPQEVVTRRVAPRRGTSYQPVRYQPASERIIVRQPRRSVQKSAIIIGSSAGVGAGIGAAVGGKKGAGIGALIGGGGAAVWDQITRRKQ